MQDKNVQNQNSTQKSELQKIEVSLRDGEQAIIVNQEVVSLINKAFGLQEDYENESKFLRKFVFEATENYVKAYASRVIGDWTRLVDKAQAKLPTKTREQVIEELLVAKSAKILHNYAILAKSLQDELRTRVK